MKPELKYSGIVFTLVKSRTNIAKETMELVRNTFGSHIKIFDTYIPDATKVSESPIYGKSMYELSSKSVASQAYTALTKEFLKDHRERKKNMER